MAPDLLWGFGFFLGFFLPAVLNLNEHPGDVEMRVALLQTGTGVRSIADITIENHMAVSFPLSQFRYWGGQGKNL